MYSQLKSFKIAAAGTKKYFCLQNVRLGFGIPAKYDTAWEAWKATEQHKTRTIPTGVDVPLYYSFTTTIDGVRKNYGHISVRLKDGRHWSDGKIYPSIKALETDLSNITYVGWGESINDVKVIKKEDDLYKGKSAKYWHDKYQQYYSYTKMWRLRYESIYNKVKTSLGKYLGR